MDADLDGWPPAPWPLSPRAVARIISDSFIECRARAESRCELWVPNGPWLALCEPPPPLAPWWFTVGIVVVAVVIVSYSSFLSICILSNHTMYTNHDQRFRRGRVDNKKSNNNEQANYESNPNWNSINCYYWSVNLTRLDGWFMGRRRRRLEWMWRGEMRWGCYCCCCRCSDDQRDSSFFGLIDADISNRHHHLDRHHWIVRVTFPSFRGASSWSNAGSQITFVISKKNYAVDEQLAFDEEEGYQVLIGTCYSSIDDDGTTTTNQTVQHQNYCGDGPMIAKTNPTIEELPCDWEGEITRWRGSENSLVGIQIQYSHQHPNNG